MYRDEDKRTQHKYTYCMSIDSPTVSYFAQFPFKSIKKDMTETDTEKITDKESHYNCSLIFSVESPSS